MAIGFSHTKVEQQNKLVEVIDLHVEKFPRMAVGHMLRHYSRMSMNFGNEAIDHLRSDYNYNLVSRRHIDDFVYYKERLAQVKCQNRADVKTLCDWIVTLPKRDFSENEERRFFEVAYKFLAKRYGEKNVLSAWVHKDETGQPHMHFAFIPVCVDPKKGIEKVSAKEVITRNDLRVIHKEMSEYMERVFGYDMGILNGSTVNGNKTVMELKTKALQDDIEALECLKNQKIYDMAFTIKNKPKVLSDISRAVNIAMGKEDVSKERQREREWIRSR